MRILFATPVPPLLNKPRPHYFIRGLVDRGHDVHLVTQTGSSSDGGDLAGAPGWKEIEDSCASVTLVPQPKLRSIAQCVVSLPSRTPLRVAYVRSRDLSERTAALFRENSCDLLHVDRERLSPSFAGLEVPKLLDATDSIALYVRRVLRHGPPGERALAAVEMLKVPRFERTMCRGYDTCVVTSREDADAIHAGGGGEAQVVPNGVSDRYFSCESDEDGDRLIFMGTMSYAPNVDAVTWFAREIFPLVRGERRGARLTIVGHKPSRRVLKLADEPGVEVTGTVPDTLPYLTSAAVHVAPMRIGGGFPNKIAEALAAGVPTVSTAAGCAGVEGVTSGKHLLIADAPRDFAAATVSLLEDRERRRRLSRAGRDLMRSRYRWENVVGRLEELYEATLASHLSKKTV